MSFKHCYILPILCAVWFYSTFIISYIISVSKKDVTPNFPYISDTGTWSPESCFFGIMMNIGAIIQASIMYIRYRHVEYLLNKEIQMSPSIKKYNGISLYFGFTAAFGVCVVGNFQETNLFSVHVAGAIAAFGLGGIYQCLQTRISFQLYPTIGNKTINYLRIFCCVSGILMFLVSFGFGGVAMIKFTGKDPTKWTKNDGGYTSHFISAVTEWIMASSSILFLALYFQEFKKISFSEPPINDEL